MTSLKRLAPVRPWFLLACGISAGLLTVYWKTLFAGDTFVLRDALRFSLPWWEFLSDSLSRFHVPEWWDGVGFGVAFAANPVYAVTSPLPWLLSRLSVSWALDFKTTLELLLLGLGTAGLTRRIGAGWIGAFFAALSVTLSGYAVSAAPNGNAPYLVWIPWIAWAALIRSAPPEEASPRARALAGAGLAVVGGLQLLSGEPGHVFVAGLVALSIVCSQGSAWKRISRLLLPTVAGVGLAAVGVIPALSLLSQSARVHFVPRVLKWSMPPGRILEWIWPLPFGSEGNESWFVGQALSLTPGDPCFAFSLYVGLPVLLLAIAEAKGPTGRRLLFASLGFVVLSLGSFTPAYTVLRSAFPPLRLVNFPEKFFFGALLLWCVSAGVGLTRALDGVRRGRLAIVSIVGALLLGAAGASVQLNRSLLESWLTPHASGVNLGAGLTISAEGAALAALGAAFFALSLFLAGQRRSAAAASLAIAGIVLPLAFAARAVTPLAPRSIVEHPPRALGSLVRSPFWQGDVRPRLLIYPAPVIRPALVTGQQIAADIHETLDTNVASRFGYDVVPGFDSSASAAYRGLWEEISPQMSFLAFVRLLGVDYALVPVPERFAPGLPVQARMPGWGIVGTFPVRPRAFVAPRATVAGSSTRGLQSLAWPGRENDPARIVVYGKGAKTLDTRGPLQPCSVRSPHPEEVQLQCESSTGGYAVLLDENLPGWSAEVDGSAVEVLTADGLFRAVRIQPGAHRVVFRYRTPGLRLGALVSLLTLALVAQTVVRAGPQAGTGRVRPRPDEGDTSSKPVRGQISR